MMIISSSTKKSWQEKSSGQRILTQMPRTFSSAYWRPISPSVLVTCVEEVTISRDTDGLKELILVVYLDGRSEHPMYLRFVAMETLVTLIAIPKSSSPMAFARMIHTETSFQISKEKKKERNIYFFCSVIVTWFCRFFFSLSFFCLFALLSPFAHAVWRNNLSYIPKASLSNPFGWKHKKKKNVGCP